MSPKKKLSAEGEHLADDAGNYDKSAYKNPAVTVDVCICRFHEKELQVLLIKRKYPPFRDHWAIPGGFVNDDQSEQAEDLDQAAARELEEETGLTGIYIEQLKSYGSPKRDPRTRVITVAYYALARPDELDGQEIEARSDAKEYGWFSLRDLPRLAFDHARILGDLLERLVGKVSYAPIAFSLVPKNFTWSELQEVYEFLLEKKIAPLNFRRKVGELYSIKQARNLRVLPMGRPAAQFMFKGMKKPKY